MRLPHDDVTSSVDSNDENLKVADQDDTKVCEGLMFAAGLVVSLVGITCAVLIRRCFCQR